MFAAIPTWLSLGATKEDISAVLGTTPNSLAVLCSQRGVSLAQRGSGGVISDRALLRGLSPAMLEVLVAEAARRGVPVSKLVVDLVAATAERDLFDVVLGGTRRRVA
jgi:hypothetical protein